MRDVLSTLKIPAAIGIALFLLSLGVIHGLPADQTIRPEIGRANPRRWASSVFQSVGYRPYADITEETVSSSPAKDFAEEVPRGEDASGPRLNGMNLRYARGYRAAFANARMWRANLEGARLSEADFRGVNLREECCVRLNSIVSSRRNPAWSRSMASGQTCRVRISGVPIFPLPTWKEPRSPLRILRELPCTP